MTELSTVSSITGNQEISVIIIDDHEAIRLALSTVCEQNNFKLLASTDSVTSALGSIAGKNPDVAVLDLSLSDGSKVEENVRSLVEKGISVLVFSIADKSQLVRAALKAGAAALVPKSHSMSELVKQFGWWQPECL